MQLAVAIGEKTNFQRLGQIATTSAALVSMVGTTTKVCDADGIPSENPSRGNGCGFTIICAIQLTSSTAI